ncbi:MAG: LamG-like jellyroll fold domain-containing protein [Caldilineaceae bacterium]
MLNFGKLGVAPAGNPVTWTDSLAERGAKRWYHLAIVFARVPGSNTGAYSFYINGQRLGTRAGVPIGIGDNVYIGKAVSATGADYAFFDGLIDDLRIFKRPLSTAEIQAIVRQAPSLNLHLDEDLASGSFKDDSQNAYTATCGATGSPNGSACPKAGDKGQMREAVTFGGSDLLTLANMTTLAQPNFSVGLWVKPTKRTSGAQRLITKSDDNLFNATFRLWLLDSSMTVRFDRQHTCVGSEANWDTVDASTPLLEDQWNHVVAVNNASTGAMAIYINGALAGRNPNAGDAVCMAANPVRIGQSFHGGIDEVSITESALSGPQVAAAYAYQSAWFDLINQYQLKLDADNPTVDLSTLPQTVSPAGQLVAIAASDGPNPLPLDAVEYRIDGGGWQQPSANGAATKVWIFNFNAAVGSHTVEVRATDFVGNAYGGLLDELAVYPQPLDDETIYDIANPLDVPISEVQVRFRSYAERDIAQDAGSWIAATLGSTSSNFTTWDVAMPSLAVGIYKIDLLVTDGVGNQNFLEGAWDGQLVLPDLSLSKTSDAGLVDPGDAISYTLSYSNTGAVPAQNVVPSEIVPTETSFDAAASSTGWRCQPDGAAGSNCSLALGDVAVGSGGTVSFTATVNDPLPAGTSRFDTAATISSDGGDADPSDNASTISVYTGVAPDLAVSIGDNAGGSIGAAQIISYTVHYTNTGLQDANATLRLVVPPQTRFLSRSLRFDPNDPKWSCPNGKSAGATCTFDLGVVPVGSSGTERFYLQVSPTAQNDDLVTTTIEITDLTVNGADLNLSDNTDSATVSVIRIFITGNDNDLVTAPEGQTITNTGYINVPFDGYEFATYPPPTLGSAQVDPITGLWNWSWDSSDGPEDSQNVTIFFSSPEGSQISTTFAISITDVAPTIDLTGAATAAVGSSYALTLGSVVDPGNDTVTACTIDWGDGNSDDCFSAIGGGTLNHTYSTATAAGVAPQIRVELIDEDDTHVAAIKQVQLTNLPVYTFNVNVVGQGSVTDGGGSAHAAGYALGTVVSLVANPAQGWELASWSGDVVTTNNSVTLTIAEDTSVTATFNKLPPTLYTLSTSVQGSGSVTPASGGTYEAGTTVPLTATAAAGWQFVSWSGDATGATPATSITMNGDKSVTATFTQLPPETHALSLVVVGNGQVTNGSVTGKLGDSVSQAYSSGTNVSVSATPAPGWRFVGWSGAASGSGSTSILVDGDKAATATFTETLHTVSTNVTGSGSVVLNPVRASYRYGDVVYVSAVPAPGWGFDGWQGNLSGDTGGESLTIDGNKAVTARFSQRTYAVSTEVVGSGNIVVEPAKPSYAYGEVVTVLATATPDSQWVFGQWGLDAGGSAISTTLTIDGDKSVLALFAEATYGLNAAWIGDGTVSVTPDQSTFPAGAAVTITAQAAAGSHFIGWNGDITSTTPTLSLIMTDDLDMVANFDVDGYVLTVNVVGNGVVTPTAGVYNVPMGETVPFTATPDSGASFLGWSGALSGTAPTNSLFMDSAKVVTATFSGGSTSTFYDLTVNVVGSGVVSPTSGSYISGTVVPITATAAAGWRFTGWSGDASGADNPLVLTMAGNKVITATFDNSILIFDYTADTNGGTNRFFVTAAGEYKIEGDDVDGTEIYTNVDAWLTRAAALYGGSVVSLGRVTGPIKGNQVTAQGNGIAKLVGKNVSGQYRFAFGSRTLAEVFADFLRTAATDEDQILLQTSTFAGDVEQNQQHKLYLPLINKDGQAAQGSSATQPTSEEPIYRILLPIVERR